MLGIPQKQNYPSGLCIVNRNLNKVKLVHWLSVFRFWPRFHHRRHLTQKFCSSLIELSRLQWCLKNSVSKICTKKPSLWVNIIRLILVCKNYICYVIVQVLLYKIYRKAHLRFINNKEDAGLLVLVNEALLCGQRIIKSRSHALKKDLPFRTERTVYYLDSSAMGIC